MATTADDTVFVREKLILGGLDLIDREGTDALSVRKLAQAAERTSMCVYTKFGSRGGLLMAVYERTARELLAAFEGAPADIERWAEAHPERYAFLFDAPLQPLGVDPSLRRGLLDDVIRGLGGDAEAERAWCAAHGRIALARIRGDDSAA